MDKTRNKYAWVVYFLLTGVVIITIYLFNGKLPQFSFAWFSLGSLIAFSYSLHEGYISKIGKSKMSGKNLTKILLFLAAFTFPAKDRDVEVGNMLERHQLDVKRHGKNKGLVLLAWDVTTSFYPLISFAIRNAIKKSLKLVGLYQIYRMFFG